MHSQNMRNDSDAAALHRHKTEVKNVHSALVNALLEAAE
jgi:hypothetical protein